MHPWSILLSLLLFPANNQTPAKESEDAVEAVRSRICTVLAKLPTDPKDRKAAEQELREKLMQIVDDYAAKLRPPDGAKRYVSRDKSFVLVLGANGVNGQNGQGVKVEEKEAKLLVVIAGDGGTGQGKTRPGSGGSADATAPNGVAVALGGRGGLGLPGTGGGGGGGGSAQGGVGDVGLGGEGGKSMGGMGTGGAGGGRGVRNAQAILAAVKQLMMP